jgi:hypothetical protein
MLELLHTQALDSVVAVGIENRGVWSVDDDQVIPVVHGFMPQNLKENFAYVAYEGLGFACHVAALHKEISAHKMGHFVVEDNLAPIKFYDDGLGSFLKKVLSIKSGVVNE